MVFPAFVPLLAAAQLRLGPFLLELLQDFQHGKLSKWKVTPETLLRRRSSRIERCAALSQVSFKADVRE